jgi:hypothetical protein
MPFQGEILIYNKILQSSKGEPSFVSNFLEVGRSILGGLIWERKRIYQHHSTMQH